MLDPVALLIAFPVIKWIKWTSRPTAGFFDTDLVIDVTRSKRKLIAENALLRQALRETRSYTGGGNRQSRGKAQPIVRTTAFGR